MQAVSIYGVDELRCQLIQTIEGHDLTPIGILPFLFKAVSNSHNSLLGSRVGCEKAEMGPHSSSMRHDHVDHYTDDRSIDVSLVLGVH